MPAAVEIAHMFAEIRGEDMTIAEIDPAKIPVLSLRADPEPAGSERPRSARSSLHRPSRGRFGRDGRRLPA
jgi:hypothetical protein